MIINANTKIANLVKAHPDALETIVSLSPGFTKLRNPVLRKVIAGRTSIAMASKLGGCSVEDFFKKLQPLGFVIDDSIEAAGTRPGNDPVPEFMKNDGLKMTRLDVRAIMDAGHDPLNAILLKVKELETGAVLQITNSFEPTPLIQLLEKRGFESYTDRVSGELVNTYFYKRTAELPVHEKIVEKDGAGWDEILVHFTGNLHTVDVRNIDMPLPMHRILEALNNLPANKALFVYHKRIPVFLLPELAEQQFSYRVKEISDSEVHMLIYKN